MEKAAQALFMYTLIILGSSITRLRLKLHDGRNVARDANVHRHKTVCVRFACVVIVSCIMLGRAHFSASRGTVKMCCDAGFAVHKKCACLCCIQTHNIVKHKCF